jgi:peptidoglycan/LPS O-acetylase OafA/YrhL
MPFADDKINHREYLARAKFGSLDGLRAISIIAVVWHHTAPSWASELLRSIGTQGVTLFFAISGFLITTLLVRERDRNGVIDLRAFYIRRGLRIFPLYYGVLAVYICAVLLMEHHTVLGNKFFDHLPYFATYTSNIFVPLDGRTIFYFAWSLAAEEQFYIFWPPLFCRIRQTSTAIALLCLLAGVCMLGQLLHVNAFSKVPLAIIAGALLALMLHTPVGHSYLEKILGNYWAPAAIALALAMALLAQAANNLIIPLLCTALVGSCVIAKRHALSSMLDVKPMVYIGSVSYGIYMLHMLCKNFVLKSLGLAAFSVAGNHVFVITLALSTIAAGLSFKYYESIFLRMKMVYERSPNRWAMQGKGKSLQQSPQ